MSTPHHTGPHGEAPGLEGVGQGAGAGACTVVYAEGAGQEGFGIGWFESCQQPLGCRAVPRCEVPGCPGVVGAGH